MKLIFLLTLGFLIGSGQAARAANSCSERLSGSAFAGLKVDETNGLNAYMSRLIELQIIGDKELLRLIDGLEKGSIINPITIEQTWISSAALIHREQIQDYLDRTSLNPLLLLEWAQKSLSEKSRVQVRREETKFETQKIFKEMAWRRVPFATYSLDVMSTLVTQKMWADEMGQNPSFFKDGAHTIEIAVRGRSVKLQPDNPVEQITWWSALEFANRISIKMGLEPAYDMSKIKWYSGTSAEAGNLAPISEDEAYKLKYNSPTGRIEDAEGFRLKTNAEKEYLLRNMGQSKGVYPHDISEAEIKDYAWCLDNSDRTTHPVGTTVKSFLINGQEIHDLIGNVREWTSDVTKGRYSSWTTSMRSGDWAAKVNELEVLHYDHCFAVEMFPTVGLRLVRTIK